MTKKEPEQGPVGQHQNRPKDEIQTDPNTTRTGPEQQKRTKQNGTRTGPEQN